MKAGMIRTTVCHKMGPAKRLLDWCHFNMVPCGTLFGNLGNLWLYHHHSWTSYLSERILIIDCDEARDRRFNARNRGQVLLHNLFGAHVLALYVRLNRSDNRRLSYGAG